VFYKEGEEVEGERGEEGKSLLPKPHRIKVDHGGDGDDGKWAEGWWWE